MNTERVPPNNIEAEEALLGSLLTDADSFSEIASLIEPEYFYREQNRWVYESLISLSESGSDIDIVTVSDDLRKKGQLDEMGGEGYVLGLITCCPTVFNVRSYAKIVKDAFTRRSLINTAATIARVAHEEDGDLEAQLGFSEAALNSLVSSRGTGSEIKDGKFISNAYLEHLQRALEADGAIMGLHTGIYELDMLNGGLEKPQMHVVAARPAMGKSSFIIGIAEHLALNMGKRILLFSMEMTTSQIMHRIVARRTGIPIRRLRGAKLSQDEWGAVNQVVDLVSRSNLIIDETVNIRPSVVRSRSSRLHSKEPLDAIFYDHLHLMGSDKYSGNPVKEVGENSKQIFNIGKELSVPSVVAAQLSRKVEERKDKRPQLQDLRESGEIEQNAYSVIFLYRDDYYEKAQSKKIGIAEIGVAKYRDGSVGTVEALWQKHTASFMNIQRKLI